MRAIILAAGLSKRLKEYTENTPKCLLDVSGREMLGRQLEILRENQVKDITIVVGFQKEKIIKYSEKYSDLNFKFVNNNEYESTNNGYSLLLALRANPEESNYILLNADVVCHGELIKTLIDSSYENALACQRKDENIEEDMKFFTDDKDRVTHLSKELKKSYGEFTGICKFNSSVARSIRESLENCQKTDFFEKAIERILNNVEFKAVDVTHYPSIEIDFPEDLEEARDIFPYNIADWEIGVSQKPFKHAIRDVSKALNLLKDLTMVLKANDIKYWLNWGTLLGFYRDKAFIPWDTDIDVTFHAKDLYVVTTKVIPLMRSLYKCYVPNIQKCCYGDLWFIRDKEKIELNYVDTVGDKYIYAPGRCDLGVPKEYIDTLTEIEVYGLKWPVPSNTEKYLELSYGSKWKTPIRYTGNNYNEVKPKSL